MADYYPLIARAVAGLEKNTGENRRALYERARTALVAQLRGVEPALEESEITRERLALEEAIRKIEAEAARQAREMPRATPPKREPHTGTRERPVPAAPVPHDPASESEPEATEQSVVRPTVREQTARTSLAEEAMKGFRNVVPDTRTTAEPGQKERSAANSPASVAPQQPAAPRDQSAQAHNLRYDREPISHGQSHENVWPPPFESAEKPEPIDFDQVASGRDRRYRDADEETEEPVEPMPPRSYRGLIQVAVVLVLVGALAALAFWQRQTISDAAGSVLAFFSGPSTPAQREPASAPARPKITDRVGQPNIQPSDAPAVAQRVVLYEEDPEDPQGKRLVGSAIWRTEMMPPTPGRPPEVAVRADVEIPERRMTMTWSLRRNTDPTLPASHTIEIMFNMPADNPSGGVQNVPGVLMKQAEQTRGVPLAGLAVKVTPGFFLIGLSSLESDMQRNMQLLKERSWFDVPIVYGNNRRAILAMEKGTPGERVFNEAFARWAQ